MSAYSHNARLSPGLLAEGSRPVTVREIFLYLNGSKNVLRFSGA